MWLRQITRRMPCIFGMSQKLVRPKLQPPSIHILKYRNYHATSPFWQALSFSRTECLRFPVEGRPISTLKRRVFKIKKHKKKKRKKRLSRLSIIPWRPPSEEKKITYQLPYKMRRIVKERRRRNKGNRTIRAPRQR